MTQLPSLVLVAFFVLFALILLVMGLGFKLLESERKRKVSTTLRTVSRVEEIPESSILTDTGDDAQGRLFQSLDELPVWRWLNAQIRQAGLDWSVGRLLIFMVVGGLAGALLGTRVTVPVYREFAITALAIMMAFLPFMYVRVKRMSRLHKFEEQFPDSLDFLSRSLRAGHAFSVCLQMIAEESPEPLCIEFRKLYHEQNLGAPLDVAMRNMTSRIPLLDVRFFVSAVLLQRETGGNLAEILDKLAYVIRERFRLRGHVRAVSAHGRITATILTIMPVVTMLGLMLVAPKYLAYLAADSDGKYLIIGSIVAMLGGYYWMRRIIDIKV